jgi:hypothetical protein
MWPQELQCWGRGRSVSTCCSNGGTASNYFLQQLQREPTWVKNQSLHGHKHHGILNQSTTGKKQQGIHEHVLLSPGSFTAGY